MTFDQPDVSGSYSFEVVDVTNEPTVELKLGDEVSPGQPTVGAGSFEFAGSVDVYSFDVTAGQAYLVRQTGCELRDTPVATLEYEGVGSGTSFLNAEACDATDRFEASTTGTVLIYASAGSSHEGTGTYGFELVDLSDSGSIALEIGDVVGPDAPASGSGFLSVPGEVDRYTLDVTAGDTVVITQLGGCVMEDGNLISMDIEGEDVGLTVFFHAQDTESPDLDCYDVSRVLIESDGTLDFTVSDVRHEATGAYRFEIGRGAATVAEADEVLGELDAVEENDEQLITLDETVLFDFGSATLKPAAVQALAEIVDVLGVYVEGEVVVTGHTDSVGSDADNERLSQQRADAILDGLVALGVGESRLRAVGMGESSPIEPNELADGSDNPEGRSANRRVEIRFSTAT